MRSPFGSVAYARCPGASTCTHLLCAPAPTTSIGQLAGLASGAMGASLGATGPPSPGEPGPPASPFEAVPSVEASRVVAASSGLAEMVESPAPPPQAANDEVAAAASTRAKARGMDAES